MPLYVLILKAGMPPLFQLTHLLGVAQKKTFVDLEAIALALTVLPPNKL